MLKASAKSLSKSFSQPIVWLATSLSLILFVSWFSAGCASVVSTNPNMPNTPLMPGDRYTKLVETHTRSDRVYDGVSEQMEYHAVLLTSDLALAQVDQNARMYLYNDSQYNNEIGTVRSNQAKQTEIFVSIYLAERKYDDLAHKNTKWKVFLDVAGQRYEAKVLKMKNQFADIQSLYPDHSRFNTPYKLIFPVSTAITENGQAKLILTGPFTSSTVVF